MGHRAVIVGAGFGGLAAGLRLQAAGVETTILERQANVGGKARNHTVAGEPIPGGPSVMTMRTVFDELFALAGEPLGARVTLKPLDVLAHHRWSPAEQLDLFLDIDRTADAIADFAGSAEADGYRKFVAAAQAIFATVDGPFIHSPKPDLIGLARAMGLSGASTIKPFDTMWSALGTHFSDPRLRQLFGRYATYCGSSPFDATATLMLVAHVEQAGVWAPEGGMAALAKGLADAFVDLGGNIERSAPVQQIVVERGRAKGVATEGSQYPADTVVYAGDVAALGAGMLGAAPARAAGKVSPKQRSLSAVTLCGRIAGPQPFGHHTVAFSGDYRAEFDNLFGARKRPDEPTIYVFVPSETPREDGSQGALIVMNAPADGDMHGYTADDGRACVAEALATLSRCDLATSLEDVVVTTPGDFHALLPGTGGALYGRHSHGWSAAFQRPQLRTKVKGLYLAGGSVHPGPGVPMAALSGRMAAECLMKDFDLQSPPPQAVTSGGILTA
ncbi:MAG: phytoene desaturase family protein [Pseudomonadota bacterium]